MIELSPHVSFLLILPPVEDVCIIPGQSDTVIEREDLVLLPVQVFEMIHLCTYQTKFISRYSRLSSILEMDIILAQQMQREVSITSFLLNKCKGRLVLHHSCSTNAKGGKYYIILAQQMQREVSITLFLLNKCKGRLVYPLFSSFMHPKEQMLHFP